MSACPPLRFNFVVAKTKGAFAAEGIPISMSPNAIAMCFPTVRCVIPPDCPVEKVGFDGGGEGVVVEEEQEEEETGCGCCKLLAQS